MEIGLIDESSPRQLFACTGMLYPHLSHHGVHKQTIIRIGSANVPEHLGDYWKTLKGSWHLYVCQGVFVPWRFTAHAGIDILAPRLHVEETLVSIDPHLSRPQRFKGGHMLERLIDRRLLIGRITSWLSWTCQEKVWRPSFGTEEY